ncbi:MAG TPA: SDR family NAD(P)-dependent oxidoreductase [Bacteroidia bacterium]|nr:SDR family NAD(P)-dependent oxidoreductase [Bacteroidia bacterium]
MSQRIAIVSGGSRGIGLAITIQLLKEGYKVIIADLADSVKDSEKLKDPNCYWHSCNITNSSQVQELFQKTIKDHGKIDLLVNNAGIIKIT